MNYNHDRKDNFGNAIFNDFDNVFLGRFEIDGTRVGITDSLSFFHQDIELMSLKQSGNLQVNGDIEVIGTIIGTTSILTDKLNIEDNIIDLGVSNTTDLLNLGWTAKYNDGVENFIGMIRDVNDSKIKVIDTTTQPQNTNVIGDNELGELEAKNVNIVSSQDYKISDVSVLNTTTLGNTVVNSSLTNVGTLSELDISGDLTVDTDTLVVDSTNKRLGIGTINPIYKLDIVEDKSGGTVQQRIRNSSADENSNARLSLTTGGNNSGDAFVSFATDGILTYCIGLDNSDGNKFKINTGTLLGINNHFTMKSTGEVGILNANPVYPLDVVGDINTSTDYKISGTQVLSSTTLGSGVVNSSLTKVGETLVVGSVGNEGVRMGDNELKILNSGVAHYSLINTDDNYLEFRNTSSGNGLGLSGDSLMVIEKTGNIGIGITNPNEKLEINGNERINGNLGLNTNPNCILDILGNNLDIINFQASGSSNRLHLAIADDDNQLQLGKAGQGNDYFTGTIDGDIIIRSDSQKLHLGVGLGVEPTLTIDSNRNIGIGEINPNFKLNIHDDAAGFRGLNIRNNNNGSGSGVRFQQNSDTAIGFLDTYSSTYLTSGSQRSNGTSLLANGQGGLSLGAFNAIGAIRFYTGSLTNERMIINSSGNVGIGKQPTQKLDINGDFNLNGIVLSNNSGSLEVDGVQVKTNDNKYAQYKQSGNQNITSGGTNTLLLSVENFDRGGFSNSNGDITVPETGLYSISYTVNINVLDAVQGNEINTWIEYANIAYAVSQSVFITGMTTQYTTGTSTINISNTATKVKLRVQNLDVDTRIINGANTMMTLTRIGDSV